MNTLTRDEFISTISRIAGSVYDFHERFSVPMVDSPSSPEESLVTLRNRLAFLMEEVGEHAKELNKGNLEDAAIELADVAFVVLGTVLTLDVSGEQACLVVARKNDSKTSETHAIEESSGKLVRRPVSR
ncbi:MAG: nucleoside triphosphate pyrophosphohydrolase family protein [Chloroflexi bacterium]|nr:nucleoside triphosphate pyrophosphohydrolase family protein [Chloroflexota bacterium]